MAPSITLGTAQFGLPYGVSNDLGRISSDQARSILNLCKQSGIFSLDTAMSYGNSESVLGLAGVSGFNVITKIPRIPPGDIIIEDWIISEVEKSLNQLKIQKLYGFLLHNPQDLLGNKGDDLLRSVINLKSRGYVDNIGISIYDPKILTNLIDLMPLDIVQAPFNVIDRRLYSQGWMDKLEKRGIRIYARSVFLQGLLIMNPENIPSSLDPFKSTLYQWHDWCRMKSLSPLAACISFVKSFRQLSSLVIGVQTTSQLIEVLESYNSNISPGSMPNISSDNEIFINPSRW